MYPLHSRSIFFQSIILTVYYVCKYRHESSQSDLFAKAPRDVKSHCNTHNQQQHHFFLNYRVATEKKVTETLYNSLACQKMKSGHPVHAFWDEKCLNLGHDWQEGFLRWLVNSKVIVLIISQKALEKIASDAQSSQDNVLVEYLYFDHILRILHHIDPTLYMRVH